MIDLSTVEWVKKAQAEHSLVYGGKIEIRVIKPSRGEWSWIVKVYGSEGIQGEPIASYWSDQYPDQQGAKGHKAAKQAAIDFVRDRLATELIAGMEPLHRRVADIERVIQELGAIHPCE